MSNLKKFIEFLEELENRKIYYKLNKTRNDTIMVEIAVPGQRWEIEYSTYGDSSQCIIEVEKFISDGTIYGAEEIDVLFQDYSN